MQENGDYDAFEVFDEDDIVNVDQQLMNITSLSSTSIMTKPQWLLDRNIEDYVWLGENEGDIVVKVPSFNTNGVAFPTIHKDMTHIDDTNYYSDTWPLVYKTDFIYKIQEKFRKISDDASTTLGDKNKIFKHQLLVQRFLSPHSINRGLLLYHRVGSGKTLSSVLIAEDHYKMMRELHTVIESNVSQLQQSRFDVIYLIPATLRKNLIGEIKQWSSLYRNHYKESTVLSLREHKIFHYNADTLIPYIKSIPGETYKNMETDTWFNMMLNNKDIPIEVNPLRNKLYVIDEIHNVVSLMKNATKKQVFLYKFFMNMKNCKILAMSGTPIRKEPYEMAILMNIIKGNFAGKTLFPLSAEDFNRKFGLGSAIHGGLTQEQTILLKRMMTGLVSYYPGSTEGVPNVTYHLPVRVTMSPTQLEEYTKYSKLEESSRMSMIGKPRAESRTLQHVHAGTISGFKRNPANAGVFRIYTRQVSNFSFPISGVQYPIERPVKKDFFDMLKFLSKAEDMADFGPRVEDALRLLFLENELNEFLNTTTSIERRGYILKTAIERHLKALRELIPQNNPQFKYSEFMENIYSSDIVRTINVIFGSNSKVFFQKFKDLQEVIGTRDQLQMVKIAFADIMGIKKPADIYDDKKYLKINPLDKLYTIAVTKVLRLLDKLKDMYLKNNKDGLKRFSPKMSQILKNIEQYEGKVFVYSNFVHVEGIHVFSKVLEANGYIKLSVASYSELMNVMNKNIENNETYPKYSSVVGKYTDLKIKFDPDIYDEFTYKLNPIITQRENELDIVDYNVQPHIDAFNSSKRFTPLEEISVDLSDQMINLLQKARQSRFKRRRKTPAIVPEFFNTITGSSSDIQTTITVRNYLIYNISTSESDENKGRYTRLNKQSVPYIKELNVIKGRYIVYTGSEDAEIKNKLKEMYNHRNNTDGRFIRIILGSGAASEGITLKSVKQVHIMEPTWTRTQTEQIIGRAVRINSHIDVPIKERNVHVFEYHSLESKEGRIDSSTDALIYEKAKNKHHRIANYLKILKECAVDFGMYEEMEDEIKSENLIQYEPDEETDILYAPNIDNVNLIDRKYRVSGTIKVCYVPIDISGLVNINDKLKKKFSERYYMRYFSSNGKPVQSLLKHVDIVKGTNDFIGYILYRSVSGKSHDFRKSAIVYERKLIDASQIKIISSIYKPDKEVIKH